MVQITLCCLVFVIFLFWHAVCRRFIFHRMVQVTLCCLVFVIFLFHMFPYIFLIDMLYAGGLYSTGWFRLHCAVLFLLFSFSICFHIFSLSICFKASSNRS